MRISQEAENAVRIVCCLAERQIIYPKQNEFGGDRMKAKDIAADVNVSVRFTLKILRKLIIGRIVKSYKGVHGGYSLINTPDQISFGEVIEAIDGPVNISKSLSRNGSAGNTYYKRITSINTRIRRELCSETIESFLI